MRATALKSCSNLKLGWLVNAHPAYTNFSQAANELMERTSYVISLELSPHQANDQ